MKRILMAAAASAALLGNGGTRRRQSTETASFRFDSARPDRSSGFRFAATFSGDRIIDTVRLQLPSGTRIDPERKPLCDKSYEALRDSGGAAAGCPASTRVGTGTARATLGGNAVDLDLALYNIQSTFMIDFTIRGQDKPAFHSSAGVSGRNITVDLSMAAELDAKAQAFSLRFTKAGSFIRTPRRCPSTRQHAAAVQSRTAGAFRTVRATTPCARR
jgi:hypothetical protein